MGNVPTGIGVALLPMWGNGIVTHGADATTFQMVAECVALALLHHDWEYVIDVLLVGQKVGQHNERIVQVFVVVTGNLLTLAIVLIEVTQFYTKHGSLNLIQTAVAPSILEDILLLRAIVGQCTYSNSQFGIVSGHGTTIAQCA